MTRIILLSTAIVTGLIASSGAMAFGGPQDPSERPSFSQLDTDSDGKVTAAELQALPAVMAAARFKATDTDGDGKISKDELAASLEQVRQGRNALRADNMIARFDTDKDGAISEQEMLDGIGQNRPAAPGERFLTWADTDKDGAISEEEYAAVADQIQQRQGRFGRDDMGRGGKGGRDQRGQGARGQQMPFWRN